MNQVCTNHTLSWGLFFFSFIHLQTPQLLEESSKPAVVFKSLEDFYTSFVCAKQPADVSQDDPNNIEGFSSKTELHEALHPSLLLMAAPFMLDNRNSTNRFVSKN